MNKLVILKRNNKKEGYIPIKYCETPQQAIEYIKLYKSIYNPYDIYFTTI